VPIFAFLPFACFPRRFCSPHPSVLVPAVTPDSRTAKEYAFNLSADPKENVNLISDVAPELKREWRLRILPATSLDSAPRLDASRSRPVSVPRSAGLPALRN
jgi:hypothetical protein